MSSEEKNGDEKISQEDAQAETIDAPNDLDLSEVEEGAKTPEIEPPLKPLNETVSPRSKTKLRFKQKFILGLRETLLAFRNIDFKSVSPSGYAAAVILIIISAVLQFIDIRLDILVISFVLPSSPYLIPLSLLIAVILVILWSALGISFAGHFARFLVHNKMAKMLFTKGNVHYIEHVPEEEDKKGAGVLISKTISLIIVWASMAALLFSVAASVLSLILGDFDPANFIVLDSAQRNAIGLPKLDFIGSFITIAFQFTVIYFLSPLLLTVIIPIPWMLIDVRLKAFDEKKWKINWYIGQKVQQRTRNLVSIGAILALGASFPLYSRAEVILQMIALILVYMALPSVIIALLYLLLFQSRLKPEIIKACDVPYGKTKVELEEDDASVEELES